jgi:predicted AlkP superfamily phosphohydrolase/phosphomutase
MKLYFIGLDGLSASILFAEENKGRWPNLEQFCYSGFYGVCECEEEYKLTGPSWTSIYTGQPVEIHMVTDVAGRPINNGRTFTTVKEPYIWDILNEHGLSCGVVTMPVTYPARKIKGYMIAGFPSPRLSFTGDIAIPEDLIVDHSQVIRCSEIVPGMGYSFHDKYTLDEDIELLKESELKKASLVPRLLQQQEVGALFVQYSGLDRIGHELNNYARRGVTYKHENILKFYDWFDAFCLPRILDVQAEYRVIVSDHGWKSYSKGQSTDNSDNLMIWGGHDIGGVVAINGPDIQNKTPIYCRNIDILPTVLDILGLPPVEVCGKSILIRSSEIEEINKQLSGLGYI